MSVLTRISSLNDICPNIKQKRLHGVRGGIGINPSAYSLIVVRCRILTKTKIRVLIDISKYFL